MADGRALIVEKSNENREITEIRSNSDLVLVKFDHELAQTLELHSCFLRSNINRSAEEEQQEEEEDSDDRNRQIDDSDEAHNDSDRDDRRAKKTSGKKKKERSVVFLLTPSLVRRVRHIVAGSRAVRTLPNTRTSTRTDAVRTTVKIPYERRL